jgi:hypothetical protein
MTNTDHTEAGANGTTTQTPLEALLASAKAKLSGFELPEEALEAILDSIKDTVERHELDPHKVELSFEKIDGGIKVAITATKESIEGDLPDFIKALMSGKIEGGFEKQRMNSGDKSLLKALFGRAKRDPRDEIIDELFDAHLRLLDAHVRLMGVMGKLRKRR